MKGKKVRTNPKFTLFDKELSCLANLSIGSSARVVLEQTPEEDESVFGEDGGGGVGRGEGAHLGRDHRSLQVERGVAVEKQVG